MFPMRLLYRQALNILIALSIYIALTAESIPTTTTAKQISSCASGASRPRSSRVSKQVGCSSSSCTCSRGRRAEGAAKGTSSSTERARPSTRRVVLTEERHSGCDGQASSNRTRVILNASEAGIGAPDHVLGQLLDPVVHIHLQ
jgi:hypothetical protein